MCLYFSLLLDDINMAIRRNGRVDIRSSLQLPAGGHCTLPTEWFAPSLFQSIKKVVSKLTLNSYFRSLLSFFTVFLSCTVIFPARNHTVRSLRLCISLYCTVPSLASLPPSPACISGTVSCLSGQKSFLVSLLSVALRRYDITRERTKAGLRNNEKIISIPCILTNSPYSLISSDSGPASKRCLPMAKEDSYYRIGIYVITYIISNKQGPLLYFLHSVRASFGR